MTLELKARDGLARICEFSTPHGKIETPTVMPVINPNLNSIDMNEMKKIGVQAVITNSYIIRRSPSLRERALKEGLHRMIDFDGPIMTDSGTFQSYVYGDFEYDNISQVDFQNRIGSDIGTIVDIFSTPEDSHSVAEHSVIETHRRYLEAQREDMILSAPIQGSVYMDLRRKAAGLMNGANPSYFAIGGVVPLLESYKYDSLVDIIANVKKKLNPAVPVHLFGAGHPMFIPLAVLMGIDFFDSASYVKYARDGRLLFSDGTRDISRIVEFPEWSPLYGLYTPSDMLSLDQDERTLMLSKHNLVAIFNEIKEVKSRIKEQTLWNYIEMKSRAHPSMYRAFLRMLGHNFNKGAYEFSRTHPYFYYDRTSLKHPIVKRLRDYTLEYLARRQKESIIVPFQMASSVDRKHEVLRNIFENYDANIIFSWNGIPVPVELLNTYPIQQSISSGLQAESATQTASYVSRHNSNNAVHILENIDKLDHLRKDSFRTLEREMLRTISEYQFGLGNGSRFITGKSAIRVSRKTGRIRTVSSGKDIIATMRPNDGLMTVTFHGGVLLDNILPEKSLRVDVNEDSAEFNSKGLNVFAKFVRSADPKIVPRSEVLVKHGEELVAVGHAVLTGKEMLSFKRGIAVNVHQGSDSVS